MDGFEIIFRQLFAVAVRIHRDQFHQGLLLGLRHFRGLNSNGFELLHCAILRRQNVRRSFIGKDHILAALFENRHERTREILLLVKRTCAFQLVLDFHLARIRCEKRWRHAHRLAIDDRVVEREMMPFKTPCPCSARRRFTEDQCEIRLVISEIRTLFDLCQKRFERHDRIDLFQAGIAQCGFQQIPHEADLLFIERFQWNPFALTGHEAPVFPLIRIKSKPCLLQLFLIQTGNQSVCRRRHLRRDFLKFTRLRFQRRFRMQ